MHFGFESALYKNTRYAIDNTGNIHQFQDSLNGVYHWAGSEGGKTLSGKEIPLKVPKSVKDLF